MNRTMKLDSNYQSIPTNEALNYVKYSANLAFDTGRQKLAELQKYAEDGDWTWRIYGLCAGIAMIILGSLNFISHLFGLSPFSAIVDMYIIGAGILCIVLEYRMHLLTQSYLALIRREALFLTRPYGRAGLYIFVGVLLSAQGGMLGFIAGVGIVLVGIIILQASSSAFNALSKMRNEHFNEADVDKLFDKYDKDMSGSLDTAELRSLCADLGTTLDKNSLESVQLLLDTDGDGKVDKNEFKAWWRQNCSV